MPNKSKKKTKRIQSSESESLGLSSKKKQGQEDGYIALDDRLNIENVGELKASLAQLLDSHDLLRIDTSNVTLIDTATLQLLVALNKEAVASGKHLIIDKPSSHFLQAVDLLGLRPALELSQVTE